MDLQLLERTIYQALVNEGSHMKVLNARKPSLAYNEKELRDAAHAEVANIAVHVEDSNDKVSRKRKNLNADEKARQSRDRNREHAKNTRLRKKAYVVKLKQLADQLTSQHQVEERDRKALGERLISNEGTRRRIITQFLNLRASNCRNTSTWKEIIEDNFMFILPITPYRSFRKSDVRGSSRTVEGIGGMIRDAGSISVLAASLGQGSTPWKQQIANGGLCKLRYSVAAEDVLVAGDMAMCRYVLEVEGSDRLGSEPSCVQSGMVSCKFHPSSNKLLEAEMIFDVMGFMQQLQRSTALLPEQCIVPNTLEMALQSSNEPRCVLKCAGEDSLAVLHINLPWTQLMGHSQSVIEGEQFRSFVEQFSPAADQLMNMALSCLQGCANWIVVPMTATSSGTAPRSAFIKMMPLSTDADTTSHLLLTIFVFENLR